MCSVMINIFKNYNLFFLFLQFPTLCVTVFLSFRPAPFFVLDEVDAALDKTNISKASQVCCSLYIFSPFICCYDAGPEISNMDVTIQQELIVIGLVGVSIHISDSLKMNQYLL